MNKFEKGIVIIDNVTVGVVQMRDETKNFTPHPSIRVRLTNGMDDIALTHKDANILLEKIKNKETVIIGINEGGNYDTLIDDYKFQ